VIVRGPLAREAASAALLCALLAAAVLLAPDTAGPGPLALCSAVAAAHAALLGPACARGRPAWGLLPLLVASPALCACSFGHPGLLASVGLVGLCALAGAAGRVLPARGYLPGMLLVFLAPYALHYLVVEFAAEEGASAWLQLSPLAASVGVARGDGLPAVCVALLLVGPVWALARRGR
jgi:hypothetical protein